MPLLPQRFLFPWYAIVLLGGSAALAAASDDEQLAPVTVQATAIPGNSIDADEVPGNVQTISAADISRQGTANLTGALNRTLGSVNLDDNLDDPFQPDLLYRGFEASPVLGTPEGLAVYEDGVRINEAFGDAVNWDLMVPVAIDQLSVISLSPVYGLNAMGGGVAVTMKNGFTYHDGDVQLYGGSFNQRAATAQYGASAEHFGLYVAADALNQDGWREFASDSVRRLYAVASARFGGSSLDLSYSGARNNLAGQGSAPVQELAISRWLVFTGPQSNLNRLNFLTLNGAFALSNTMSLQTVLYDREYAQTVSNGDNSDYGACTDEAALCQDDGVTPLTNSAGEFLPDISEGGTLLIGQNDFERITAYGRGAALQLSDNTAIAAHTNHFSAGATFDDATIDFYSGTQIGLLNSQLTVLPSDLDVYTPEGTDFSATPVSLHAEDRYYGLFLTDTFNIAEPLAVTVSGRYNIADINLTDRLGTSLTGDNRYSHFNPALGATWRLVPALTAYAGFSENARAPTASEIECSNPLQPCLLPSNLASDPPTLRQVVAQTFELGVRGRIPDFAPVGLLTWNLGVFRTNLHDDIYGISTTISSGFFQNVGATRRQGLEAALRYTANPWSAQLSYSYVEATFRSALTLASPSNPYQDDDGNIQVVPGDRLPGIPLHRLKMGVEYQPTRFGVGADLQLVSSAYFFGDESNQNAPVPEYGVIDLYGVYNLTRQLRLFATVDNLFNKHYATYGIYGDPTGVGAPGVPPDADSDDPSVNNRFESPAAPFSIYGGVTLNL